MKTNIIQLKLFDFAIRIINSYRYLTSERKEYVLSKQLLRSGTSIGANVEEAVGGHSKADFLSKLTIAYKESRETQYWIKLLEATGYFDSVLSESLQKDLDEISRIIAKIQLTTKANLASSKQNTGK